MKNFCRKIMSSSAVATLALALTILSANSCCQWFYGQSEEPDAVKALRRF